MFKDNQEHCLRGLWRQYTVQVSGYGHLPPFWSQEWPIDGTAARPHLSTQAEGEIISNTQAEEIVQTKQKRKRIKITIYTRTRIFVLVHIIKAMSWIYLKISSYLLRQQRRKLSKCHARYLYTTHIHTHRIEVNLKVIPEKLVMPKETWWQILSG